ncbi:nitrite reductase small subunit NirD [Rhodococcus sp. NPDC003322]
MTVIDSHAQTVTGSGRDSVADGRLEWTSACPLSRLIPGLGVAVLLRGGEQVALFLLDDGTLRAVGNIDPFGRAAVMSRGLVGDRAGEPTVASPLLKQVFSLVDGRCLDDEEMRLPVYDVRVWGGVVQVHSPLQAGVGTA